MKADLIITTYNRPDALEAVLVSVLSQTILPESVIIADDGSAIETKNLILAYSLQFPVPLIHSWQEDLGFRAAESRNKALSKVKADYVIMIDGDKILDKHFIEDHLKFSQDGYFIQGGRVLLTSGRTSAVLKTPSIYSSFTMFTSGLEERLEKRLTSFRSIVLANFFVKDLLNKNKVRSCNMSFFYKDIVRVNGFNNKFVGWGREDSEFVERLLNAGIKGKILKFAAIGYHLYHKEEPRSSLPENDKLLEFTIVNKLCSCEDGLSNFR